MASPEMVTRGGAAERGSIDHGKGGVGFDIEAVDCDIGWGLRW